MPSVSRGLYKWFCRRNAKLEDLADRLNHFWTFGLLLLLASIISWRQTYSRPIQCWTPSQFTTEMSTYAHDVCWNSPYILYPDDQEKAQEEIREMLNMSVTLSHMPIVSAPNRPIIDTRHFTESSSLIRKMSSTRTLYQWLPVILCIQALLFKLPSILMYALQNLSGINFDKIAGLTNGYENLALQERSILCRQIGRYIYNWCRQCENCLPWRLLTLLWFIVKVLFCINITVQLKLMDDLLAPQNATSFGDVITGNLFENNATTWEEAPVFPKKIFCKLPIINLNRVESFLFQCNLSANYFNEFVYMFLWVWLVFVAVVTWFSLLVWLLTTLIPVFRKRYITKMLSLTDELDGDLDINVIPAYDIGKFCDVIGEDGIMALKLAGSNSSDLMVSGILKSMWQTKASMSASHGGGQVLNSPTIHVQASVPTTVYPSLQTGSLQQGEKKMD